MACVLTTLQLCVHCGLLHAVYGASYCFKSQGIAWGDTVLSLWWRNWLWDLNWCDCSTGVQKKCVFTFEEKHLKLLYVSCMYYYLLFTNTKCQHDMHSMLYNLIKMEQTFQQFKSFQKISVSGGRLFLYIFCSALLWLLCRLLLYDAWK